MLAYVLISLKDNRESKMLEQLKKNPSVEEVHILFGEYDLIVKVNSEDSQKLSDFVLENIKKDESVEDTLTLIIAK